jgi:uncharacterized protein
MTRHAWSFLAGLVFAVGLGLAGMTQPSKIIGFLDFAGHWDPTLLFVMGGAVSVFFVAARSSRRLARPFLADRFPDPPSSGVDVRLVAGAAIFGVGWGLSGFCPGPAIVVIGGGGGAAIGFVGAMIAGMGLHQVLVGRAADDAAPASCE